MKLRFFDFEVFPKWWCCVFGNQPDEWSQLTPAIKSQFWVVDSDMPNARDLLMRAMKDPDNWSLCGYNIKRYDLMIANAIYQGFTPQQVKIVSDLIIDQSLALRTKEHMRLAPFARKRLSGACYQDLFDEGDGSLKEKEATLGLSIIESSVPFDKEDLTGEDKIDVISYCKHDVYSSMVFFNQVVQPHNTTKIALHNTFKIPEQTCRICTNAQLAATILGAKRTQFADAEREDIVLPERMRQYCYDNIPSKVLDRLCASGKVFSVNMFENTVSFGDGGIHSILRPHLFVEENEEWILTNVDAASYYPALMILFNCLSRAVPNPELFKSIFDTRIAIKLKENRTQAENEAQAAYKLILNSASGAAGDKYNNMYDPYMRSYMCRLGQIFLLALANKLYHAGAHIIQTNTDAILIYVRRKDLPLIDKITDEWTALTSILLEHDPVKRIWQKDVNNYLLETPKGKIKRKGAWLQDGYIKPGSIRISPLTGYVCGRAVIDYLLYGKDIVKTIVNHKVLNDFALTCKKGPSFKGVIQRMADGSEIESHRCNRVIATKDMSFGQIFKYKEKDGIRSYNKMPNVPDCCKLVNDDLSSYDFNEIRKELDYMYYISKCADMLNLDWYEMHNGKLIKIDKFDYFNI